MERNNQMYCAVHVCVFASSLGGAEVEIEFQVIPSRMGCRS